MDGLIEPTELASYIGRIEKLEEEKATLTQDIRDLYLEAKGNGFDPKIMRLIVSERKKEQHVLDEEGAMLAIYREALAK